MNDRTEEQKIIDIRKNLKSLASLAEDMDVIMELIDRDTREPEWGDRVMGTQGHRYTVTFTDIVKAISDGVENRITP